MFTRTLSAAKTMTRPDVGTSFSVGEPGTAWNEKSSDDPRHPGDTVLWLNRHVLLV
jgi:hypothetical protein